MFEPENQSTSGQSGQEEGSVLQRFLSQLGMPASLGPGEPNSVVVPSGDPQSSGRQNAGTLPRYYGAPPDPMPTTDSPVSSSAMSRGGMSSSATMASEPGQTSESWPLRIGLASDQNALLASPPGKVADQTSQATMASPASKSGKSTQRANGTGNQESQGAPLDQLVRWDPLADSRAQIEDDRMLTEQSSRSPRSFPARDPKTLPQASRRWREVSPAMTEFAKIAVPKAVPNHLRNYLPYVVDALRERGFDLN